MDSDKDPAGTPPFDERRDALAARIGAAREVLLCLDFDGTLAPITEAPNDARPLPAVEDPLRALAEREDLTLAIVSGRALADVRERVGLPGVAYAGNHGLELAFDGERVVHPDARAARDAVQDLCAALERDLGDVPGCVVENKTLTATVHYRQVPPDRVERVRERVARAVDRRDALRRSTGKAIVEVRPAVDWGKGDAVAYLADELADDPFAAYVGDDATDESAFRAVEPDGVGVHVGPPGTETAATCRLPDPAAVADFLGWFDATLDAAGT